MVSGIVARYVILSGATLAPHASAGENLYDYLGDPSPFATAQGDIT